ncbi:MAG: DUF393 domain-containing protein [Bryobacteraceae bacterium]|nr:DUF393 domain-containing protein [Bryobacteraceae bacterium]
MDVHLTHPAERAGADVVIYDGQCRFCIAQVSTLAKLDLGKRLAFLSLHDPLARTLCPNLAFADLMKQMYLVTRDGRQFGGADAVRYLSRHLVALWWLAPLIHLPRTTPFWNWLYRQIALRRYWFGRIDCPEGSCRLDR